MRPFPLILALLALSACTIVRSRVGVAPPRGALALVPGESRLGEVLALLGPPDLFCDERGARDLRPPTALSRVAALPPEVFPAGSAGPCLLWLGEEGRDARVDFGRLIELASFAVGFRLYVPALFGQNRRQLHFVRVTFGAEGLVQAVHGNFPPGLDAIEVSPFD